MPLPSGITPYHQVARWRHQTPSPTAVAIARWKDRQQSVERRSSPDFSDPRAYANTVLDQGDGALHRSVSVGLERRPDGSAICTRVVIEAAPHPDINAKGITSGLIKSIPFGRLIRQAGPVVAADMRRTQAVVNEFHRVAGVEPPAWPDAPPLLDTDPPARGRPRLEAQRSGELLREVAKVVREAVIEGRPPVVAVEKHFHCPRRTAQNRIRRAREVGVLEIEARSSGVKKNAEAS